MILKDIFQHFYTHQSRLIFPCKRACEKTEEFNNSYRGLNSTKQQQVDELIGKIEQGEDLKLHQSRLVENYDIEKLDKLLFDWGIYHLHLRPAPGRTSELIYCVLTCKKAYLIDIKSHLNFEDIKLLEILDKTWEHLLIDIKLPENIESLCDISSAPDIKAIRKNNFETSYKINGKLVMGIGGGLTSAGTSGLSNTNIRYLQEKCNNDPSPYIIPKDNIWYCQNVCTKEKIYNCCRHHSLNLFKDK